MVMAKKKVTATRPKKRETFIVYSDTKKKLNYIAVMDDSFLTGVVEKAFTEFISNWEKKNGPIPVK
jgi:hypothetical protein